MFTQNHNRKCKLRRVDIRVIAVLVTLKMLIQIVVKTINLYNDIFMYIYKILHNIYYMYIEWKMDI